MACGRALTTLVYTNVSCGMPSGQTDRPLTFKSIVSYHFAMCRESVVELTDRIECVLKSH